MCLIMTVIITLLTGVRQESLSSCADAHIFTQTQSCGSQDSMAKLSFLKQLLMFDPLKCASC